MPSLDDAALGAMLVDPDLRTMATQILSEAVHQMRYELKYGTPLQRAAIYRSVTSALLRQSLTRQHDEGLEDLKRQLEEMRDEMRSSAPTAVGRSLIRADEDNRRSTVAHRPPAIPPPPHRKAASMSGALSTKDLT